MTPSERLMEVADGTMIEPEGVLLNVKIKVEDFKFLADIVVMDMVKSLVTLGRSFLVTEKARINTQYREIMLKSKGQYMIYHLSQRNIRPDAGTECHAVEVDNPYSSHGSIEPTRTNQDMIKEDNINMWDVMEIAIGGPYEVEDFEVRDHVMFTNPKEFNKFCGNQRPRRGWDGPFSI